MNWEPGAEARAGEVLSDYAAELYAEAERVAARVRAGTVSAAYVDDAAFTIGIRRPSNALGDLLLAVGICMIGLAGGVLAVILTTPKASHLDLHWVGPTAVGISCAGFLLSGVGGALKIRNG